MAEPPTSGTVRPKSIAVAYMWWVLLWWCGGHRFYSGRMAGGVITLVLLFGSLPFLIMGIGIFAYVAIIIWGLVDLVLIPGWIRAYNRGETKPLR